MVGDGLLENTGLSHREIHISVGLVRLLLEGIQLQAPPATGW